MKIGDRLKRMAGHAAWKAALGALWLLASVAGTMALWALAPMSSANYKIPRAALNSSGNRATSANNILSSSGGEVISGLSTSGGYVLYKGFWNVSVYPGTITTLIAVSSTNPSTVNLTWIAPGADGFSGDAAGYIVRFSSDGSRIRDEVDFSTEPAFGTIMVPRSPMSEETLCVTGLEADKTYYFSVKATSGAGVHGFMSTGTVSIYLPVTLSVSVDLSQYDFGLFSAVQSTISATPAVVTNSGNVLQRYRMKALTATPGGTPWTISETRGSDQVVVNGLFNSARPGDAGFEAVISTMTTSDLTSGGAGGNFAGDETGTQVPVSGTRKLWFRLGMPLSTSTTEEQKIQVTITAESSP